MRGKQKTETMTLEDIASFLRNEREKRGISKYKIKAMTGLHRDTINAIESGDDGYNVKALILYCNSIGLQISILENFNNY